MRKRTSTGRSKRKITIEIHSLFAVVPSVTQSVTHISIIILNFNRKPSTHLALTLTYTALTVRDKRREQKTKKNSYQN